MGKWAAEAGRRSRYDDTFYPDRLIKCSASNPWRSQTDQSINPSETSGRSVDRVIGLTQWITLRDFDFLRSSPLYTQKKDTQRSLYRLSFYSHANFRRVFIATTFPTRTLLAIVAFIYCKFFFLTPDSRW